MHFNLLEVRRNVLGNVKTPGINSGGLFFRTVYFLEGKLPSISPLPGGQTGAWPCLVAHLTEAIAAVHRAVSPRAKRHLGVDAALSAYRRMHLSWAAKAAPLLSFTGITALGTTLGFVGITPSRVKFLFSYRKRE